MEKVNWRDEKDNVLSYPINWFLKKINQFCRIEEYRFHHDKKFIVPKTSIFFILFDFSKDQFIVIYA